MTAVKLSELAARAKRDPFELDLEDGGAEITIAQPTVGQWAEAVAAPTVGDFLATLGVAPADVERVTAVMPGQLLGTEGGLVASIRARFGLGN